MKELVNTSLGQYYLTEVIGRGSTSVVYKAYQSSLNRFVAVKVLAANIGAHFEARFKREAHAVAQLQHANILPIYDYGEQGGHRYFVMQYVEGSVTLDDMLGGQPMEPIAALRLMLPLLSALKYAHARGVIHRDIKPANIMMSRPDWPMLADFGIAKLADESQQLTPPGQSVGTAIYMAPERATSSAVDARTDLYSVGVVLYEMLTGKVPFEGTSPVEVLRKHVHMPPPPPRSINPRLPPVVEPALLRALAKDPADRYQSAEQMAQDLERVIGQLERLNAQRQLQQMLQQPAGRPAVAPASAPNPYQTHELGSGPLPPATPMPVRQRNPMARFAIPAVLLVLALAAFAMTREARGVSDPNEASAAATASLALQTTPAVSAPLASAPTAALPAASLPAPTEVAAPPVAQPSPRPAPTEVAAPPVAQPSPRPAPTEVAAPAAPPAPPAAPASTPQVSQSGPTTTVRLEDTDWQGGYRRAGGRTYGGRTATWVYGTSTPYNTMEASFELGAPPNGTAVLLIEGMDSEDRLKTPISIRVNGVEIFNGPNPLPDDDHPLETGTWASYTWQFDAALLQAGRNEITIANLAEGAFSLPPFFMLDYAEISYGVS